MAYLVAFSYIVIHVIAFLIASDSIDTEQISNTSVPGLGMLSRLCSSFGIYTLLLAPTIWHVALIYVPGFVICIIHLIHRHAEFEYLFIVISFYFMIVMVTAWYIF